MLGHSRSPKPAHQRYLAGPARAGGGKRWARDGESSKGRTPWESGRRYRGTPVQTRPSMNTQDLRWMALGPTACRAARCTGHGYPLLSSKLYAGKAGGLGDHHPVAGHLGQDRGGGDREGRSITSDYPPGAPMAHEVPPAVHQHPVHRHVQPGQGSTSREPLGLGHPEAVTLRRAGVPHRPGQTPTGDPVEEGLPLRGLEELGVPDLVDPAIPGRHNRPHRDRPPPMLPCPPRPSRPPPPDPPPTSPAPPSTPGDGRRWTCATGVRWWSPPDPA